MLDFVRNCSLDIVDFDGNKVCPLYDTYLDVQNIAQGISVTTQRNGWKTITFSINSPDNELMENFIVKYIKPEYRIRIIEYKQSSSASGAQVDNTDYYILDKPKITHNNYSKTITITASHISAILKYRRLDLEFSDENYNNTGTAKELLITILEGTGWSVGEVTDFYEKYDSTKIKKRSLQASSKTGAFNLIAKMCDLFEAKPVYHGDTRKVDILPLNPFSKDTIDPTTGLPDLSKAKNVIELNYSHNVKNISKSYDSENMTTKLYCYGSYGDTTKGYCSIYSLTHKEYVGTIPSAGNYYIQIANPFDITQVYVMFTATNAGEFTFSCKDRTSMLYVFNEDEDEIYRTTISGVASGTQITVTDSDVQNWTQYLLDFTYYVEEGLLSDDQLYDIACYQRNTADYTKDIYQANVQFANDMTQTTLTIGDLKFVKLDVDHAATESGNKVLYLTDEKIIYRTDYYENEENYFDWYVAKSIKDNGDAINSEASMIYVVHSARTTGETYERTYIRAIEDNKLVLWKDVEYYDTDDVYLFQSYSVNGTIGALECEVAEKKNEISYYNSTSTSTQNHPVYFGIIGGSPELAKLDNFNEYGWYILPFADTAPSVYFCYKNIGDTGWLLSYIGATEPSANTYYYYYNTYDNILYYAVGGVWEQFYDSNADADAEWARRKKIYERFVQLPIFINIYERAWKGIYEQYLYTVPTAGLPSANYYYEDDYNNLYLFTTTKAMSAGDTLTLDTTKNYVTPTYYSGSYTDILSGATWTAGSIDSAGYPIDSRTQQYSNDIVVYQDMLYNVSRACTLSWYNSSNLFVKQTILTGAQSVIGPANAAFLKVTRPNDVTITMTTNGSNGDILSPIVASKFTANFATNPDNILKNVAFVKGTINTTTGEDEDDDTKLKTTWVDIFENTTYYFGSEAVDITYSVTDVVWTKDGSDWLGNVNYNRSADLTLPYTVVVDPDVGGTYSLEYIGNNIHLRIKDYTSDPTTETVVTVTAKFVPLFYVDFHVFYYSSKTNYIGYRLFNASDVKCFKDSNDTKYWGYYIDVPAKASYIRVVKLHTDVGSLLLRVKDHKDYIVYAKDTYGKQLYKKLTPWTSAGDLLGLFSLIKKFVQYADATYLTDRTKIQTLTDELSYADLQLINSVGEIYKESTWQDANYIAGKENELFFDAVEKLDSASHPQITYDIGYQDLYNVKLDENIVYPDIDINSALHILDEDLDENLWAFVDQVTKCYDQPWKTTIKVNTNLTTVANQTFSDVMSSFADVTSAVKASEGVVDAVSEITSGKQVIGDLIQGTIDAAKASLNGAASSWYTDDKGNIIFEASTGSSAMKLSGNGFCVANKKDEFGDWMWSTFGTGDGFTADLITGGTIRGNLIEAGSITTDMVTSTFGNQLEIGSNKGLTLFATVDGTRPAGSVNSKKDGVSYITITPDGIEVWAGSSLNMESGSTATLKGTDVTIDGTNSTTILSGADLDITATGNLNLLGENINVGSDTMAGTISVKSAGKISARNTDNAGIDIDQTGVLVEGSTIKLINHSDVDGQIVLGDEKNIFYSSGKLVLNDGNLIIDGSVSGQGTITSKGKFNVDAGGSINISTDTSSINMTAGSINATAGKVNLTSNASMNINSGGAFTLSSDGVLTIDSPYFIVHPDTTNATGYAQILGTVYATQGQIGCSDTKDGGWLIDSNKIYSGTVDTENYIELNSKNDSSENWTILVGGSDTPTKGDHPATFAVRRDGVVLINKLVRYKDKAQTKLETLDLRTSLWQLDHAVDGFEAETEESTGKVTLTIHTTGAGDYEVNFTSGAAMKPTSLKFVEGTQGESTPFDVALYNASGKLVTTLTGMAEVQESVLYKSSGIYEGNIVGKGFAVGGGNTATATVAKPLTLDYSTTTEVSVSLDGNKCITTNMTQSTTTVWDKSTQMLQSNVFVGNAGATRGVYLAKMDPLKALDLATTTTINKQGDEATGKVQKYTYALDASTIEAFTKSIYKRSDTKSKVLGDEVEPVEIRRTTSSGETAGTAVGLVGTEHKPTKKNIAGGATATVEDLYYREASAACTPTATHDFGTPHTVAEYNLREDTAYTVGSKTYVQSTTHPDPVSVDVIGTSYTTLSGHLRGEEGEKDTNAKQIKTTYELHDGELVGKEIEPSEVTPINTEKPYSVTLKSEIGNPGATDSVTPIGTDFAIGWGFLRGTEGDKDTNAKQIKTTYELHDGELITGSGHTPTEVTPIGDGYQIDVKNILGDEGEKTKITPVGNRHLMLSYSTFYDIGSEGKKLGDPITITPVTAKLRDTTAAYSATEGIKVQGTAAEAVSVDLADTSTTYSMVSGYLRQNTPYIPISRTLIGTSCKVASYTIADTDASYVIGGSATPIDSSGKKYAHSGTLRGTVAYFNPTTKYSATSAGNILKNATAVTDKGKIQTTSGIDVQICKKFTPIDTNKKYELETQVYYDYTGDTYYIRGDGTQCRKGGTYRKVTYEDYTSGTYAYFGGSVDTCYSYSSKYLYTQAGSGSYLKCSGGTAGDIVYGALSTEYYGSADKAYNITTGGTEYYLASTEDDVYYSSEQPYTGTYSTTDSFATDSDTYYVKQDSKTTGGYETYIGGTSCTYIDDTEGGTAYYPASSNTTWYINSASTVTSGDTLYKSAGRQNMAPAPSTVAVGECLYAAGDFVAGFEDDTLKGIPLYRSLSSTQRKYCSNKTATNVPTTLYAKKTDTTTYTTVADKYNESTETVTKLCHTSGSAAPSGLYYKPATDETYYDVGSEVTEAYADGGTADPSYGYKVVTSGGTDWYTGGTETTYYVYDSANPLYKSAGGTRVVPAEAGSAGDYVYKPGQEAKYIKTNDTLYDKGDAIKYVENAAALDTLYEVDDLDAYSSADKLYKTGDYKAYATTTSWSSVPNTLYKAGDPFTYYKYDTANPLYYSAGAHKSISSDAPDVVYEPGTKEKYIKTDYPMFEKGDAVKYVENAAALTELYEVDDLDAYKASPTLYKDGGVQYMRYIEGDDVPSTLYAKSTNKDTYCKAADVYTDSSAYCYPVIGTGAATGDKLYKDKQTGALLAPATGLAVGTVLYEEGDEIGKVDSSLVGTPLYKSDGAGPGAKFTGLEAGDSVGEITETNVNYIKSDDSLYEQDGSTKYATLPAGYAGHKVYTALDNTEWVCPTDEDVSLYKNDGTEIYEAVSDGTRIVSTIPGESGSLNLFNRASTQPEYVYPVDEDTTLYQEGKEETVYESTDTLYKLKS